ncbi:hypothetical protein GHT06_011701 [Daphnia sinensis]|uniref:Uncharacterized protein n=1 Tax=Daphnia sinensis TaxID=1820382 RepID=A0AAD5KUC0_9CRUS|nr:hypothetical protein GHT06_011701 [Daphnia sinensis]
MKSFLIATWVALFLIGTCVAMEADASADKPTHILTPDGKELAMEGADQAPAETKHWWYGHKYDWDKKKHGDHEGGHWEGKHGKAWWWKWH